MLSLVIYGLLATGSNAAEIRRRQELTLATPRVIVQPQGQAPQIPQASAWPTAAPQSQGTYFTRPPGPEPSGPLPSGGAVPPVPNQNLVVPRLQPGSGTSDAPGPGPGPGAPGDNSAPPSGPSQDSNTPITPGGTGKDLTNTPPALLGPNDTPGPDSWEDVLPNLKPGSDDHAPEGTTGPVTAEVENSTNEAVNILTDDQKANLLENTSPTEFETSTPDFQELVLVAAQDKLADSEAKAEAIADITGGETQPVTSLSQEDYAEIQDIGSNMTEKSAQLSKTLRELIDISLDELRNNATLDATGPGELDANGNTVPPMKKRWLTTVISTLGLLLELTKLADGVLDEGIAFWKKIKNA
ncbi:hypothetical protein TWF481_001222 [Arthrobotrys musiformis]|uniref:Uncharacterized protein n=1 Tax=Arthrobotrys musiformis TaxID=47236 RepID=A0AAV9WQY8_9PEZI